LMMCLKMAIRSGQGSGVPSNVLKEISSDGPDIDWIEERNTNTLRETIIDTIKLRMVKLKVKSSKAVVMVEERWDLKFLDKV
ncbi:hypothetical protein Tco_0671334, partial [Tanacetum coccineum]